MAEKGGSARGRSSAGGRRGEPGGSLDRELDLRGIWGFAALVAATTAFLHLVVWGLVVGFRETAERRDPAPSPLPEANERRLPPAPRLQDAPVRDMEALRAEEDARLSSYGWIDSAAGVGRIPIDRAIDLILERGLPEVSAPSAAPEADPGAAPGPAGSSRRPRRGRDS
jgi:hypothetical protein